MSRKTEEERGSQDQQDQREPTLEELCEELNNELGLVKTENESLAKELEVQKTFNEELQKNAQTPEALKNKINECATLKTNLENLIRATEEEKERYFGVLRFLNDSSNSPEQKSKMIQHELAK